MFPAVCWRTFFILLFIFAHSAVCGYIPYPFVRELSLQQPNLVGDDVKTAQFLLLRFWTISFLLQNSFCWHFFIFRDPAVQKHYGTNFTINGVFEEKSAIATRIFQNAHSGLKISGIFDSETAGAALKMLSADGVRDDGFTARSKGYLYKINIPVYNNRSIETFATLYDQDNNVLFRFRARTHGRREDNIDWGFSFSFFL